MEQQGKTRALQQEQPDESEDIQHGPFPIETLQVPYISLFTHRFPLFWVSVFLGRSWIGGFSFNSPHWKLKFWSSHLFNSRNWVIHFSPLWENPIRFDCVLSIPFLVHSFQEEGPCDFLWIWVLSWENYWIVNVLDFIKIHSIMVFYERYWFAGMDSCNLMIYMFFWPWSVILDWLFVC